jgi:hypothetical protein
LGEEVAVRRFDDAAGSGHGGQTLVEGGSAQAAQGAQIGEWLRVSGFGEGGGDALVDRALLAGLFWLWSAVDDFEGEGIGALGEFEGNGGHGGCGAVLDGKGELIAVTAQIEVGVTPGVELGRAAQGLAGSDVAGAFPGMVDDADSQAVAALQLAQEGEQRRHLAAEVLVDAMQADEGIEDEETRLQPAMV